MGGLAFLLLPFLAPMATTAVNPALKALASLNLEVFPTFQPDEANNYSVFYFEQKYSVFGLIASSGTPVEEPIKSQKYYSPSSIIPQAA
ncbi:lysosomal Pro-X carboxypeptidase-like protein [Cricetulus griseus]|uniref:Lysosomal Pro-X carboxypeptidase-like protein n=1 Tax=Cricetulus griseus TaxID=10029 RepID=A0A061IC86_CRIGR|nr:lysosomal Pro-X carboxypeptidase-like protein [Cricetulus griseus]